MRFATLVTTAVISAISAERNCVMQKLTLLIRLTCICAMLTACNPLFVAKDTVGTVYNYGSTYDEWRRGLDTGHIVNLTECDPSDTCTVWLAGHRTTYGAVFADIPKLNVGDTVQLVDEHNHVYRVYDITYAAINTTASIPEGADLVIQTSIDQDTAILILAKEIQS